MNLRSILKVRTLLNISSVVVDNVTRFSHKVRQRRILFKPSSMPSFNEGSFGSRYFPPSALEMTESKMREILANESIDSHQRWATIKEELMMEHSILTEVNFSSIMMNCLLHINNTEYGHSFMAYLKESHSEINILTYLKYMALCGRNVDTCNQELILEAFEKVKASVDSLPVLDLKRTEHLVQALFATDKWKLCFDYLKKLPCPPTPAVKSYLAAAAIRHDEESLFWEISQKWIKREEEPHPILHQESLLRALRLQLKEPKQADVFISKVFQYIQYRTHVLSEEHIKLVNKYFSSYPSYWKTSYAKVSRTGECDCCKKHLEITDFSESNFEQLRNFFLERSLKKSDVFINTTLQEFDQYISFIEKRKPFDVVVDGLNASYSALENSNPKDRAIQLLTVAEDLSKRYGKILILGKRYMNKWPKRILTQISQIANLFFTNNNSQDDPFMVYATLASGPHCHFLSRDLMRDHMARLDDPILISLFKRWQQTHQIILNTDAYGRNVFVEPLRHSINIQGSIEDGWHIPFDDKFVRDTYEELNNWLCVQRNV